MGFLSTLSRLWKSNRSDFSGNRELKPVHKALQNLIALNKVPGMAITVFHNGKIYFDGAYGYADLKHKITVDTQTTQFRAASASKPIAATALLAMVEQGSINLDASFYQYVPYYPKKQYDFTVRQLASHTAGIRAYRGKEFALNRPMTIREGIEFFKDDPLLFKPGTAYLYNSLDWVLISLAMEEASGMPFQDLVKELVLDPLKMFHTSPEIPGEDNFNCVTCYTSQNHSFRKAIPVDNRYKLAGGGYLTTTWDLCKLGQAYLEDRIKNTGHRREFLTPVSVKGEEGYYGLGWEVSRDHQGRDYFGHTGNGVGGYSNFFVYPGQKTVIATLINCTDPGIQGDLNEVYDHIFSTFKDQHPVKKLTV